MAHELKEVPSQQVQAWACGMCTKVHEQKLEADACCTCTSCGKKFKGESHWMNVCESCSRGQNLRNAKAEVRRLLESLSAAHGRLEKLLIEKLPRRKGKSFVRFEEQLGIELRCARTVACKGKPMKLVGNFSLREAGEAGLGVTILGYECECCFWQIAVTDAWPQPSPAMNAAHDDVP
jgi:hypothetical protein